MVLTALACTGDTALAAPPPPVDLDVLGGTETWHADNRFSLRWSIPQAGGSALRATLYRVRSPQGDAVAAGRLDGVAKGIDAVAVPRIPGAYSAEVWFEDTTGQEGPAATARLRFDDLRPAPAEPEGVPAWIGRSSFPLRVPLRHPANPLPLSGIGGYAVAIDSTPDSEPCAAHDRCTGAETTLGGGIWTDTVAIPALPEGVHYLHAVAISGSGMKSTRSGHAELRVDLTDPVTQLSPLPSGWTNRAVSLFARATDGGSGMTASPGSRTPFTAIRVDGGTPTIGTGATVAASVIGEGIHQVAYYASDAAGNIDDGGRSNGVVNRAPRTAMVRIDRSPPSVAFANSQSPHDPDLLRATVADALSGPDESRGRIGVRLAGSGDAFEALATVIRNGELRARWSSDAYPVGDYEFQATAYDDAGNVAMTTRRRDGSSMTLSNPLKAATHVSASFSRGRTGRVVRAGRGVRLTGRLTTGVSSPLGGMGVRIVERFAPGSRPAVRASTVRTGPDGSYSVDLAAGASREVEVVFPGNATLARSVSGPLRLGVLGTVRLSASARVARVGGPPIVFRGGVLPAGAVPSGGRSVQLQFRLAGGDWSEFRTVETNRSGRFRYAYRFSDDDSRGARFQFRAFVPAQEDWPYEPAGSRPVPVRGI